MEDENFIESTSKPLEKNTITFQIDDENGNPKEVIKISDEGFFIYGERLKSADDVAAAFRHFFAQTGYEIGLDGKIVAEEVDEEDNRGEESKEDE